MPSNPTITWNNNVKLVVSDVDETIADVHMPIESKTANALAYYLANGGALLLVSGGSKQHIANDVVYAIPNHLRHKVIISSCSGVEAWGFTESGILRKKPFYNLYEAKFTQEMKQSWRTIMDQLIAEFELRLHPVQPRQDFWDRIGTHPKDIMYDDRGSQITLSLINARDITTEQCAIFDYDVPLTDNRRDVRMPLISRAEELLRSANLPISPRIAGMFSVDFAMIGINKATAIQSLFARPAMLQQLQLTIEDLTDPSSIEIWGDKFSVVDGGTDRHMCEALDPQVRAIDFRTENPAELPKDFHIVIWDGEYHLHKGLQEYLLASQNTTS